MACGAASDGRGFYPRLAGCCSERRFLVLLVGIALAVFGTKAVLWPSLPLLFDPEHYQNTAVNLWRGEGYVLRLEREKRLGQSVLHAYRPPGFSAFLAATYTLTGPHPMAGILANTALLILNVALTYALGRTVAGEGVARLGALLYVVLATTTRMGQDLYPEALFTTALLGATALALGAGGLWRHVAAGLVLGFAHLVRPISLALPVLFFLALVLRGRPWRWAAGRMLLVLVVSLGVVAPWTWRNWRRFGRGVLVSTNGGMNLWIGNNPQATGGYMHLWKLPPGETRSVPFCPWPPGANEARDEVEWDRAARRAAVDFLFSHPGIFLRRIPSKLVYACGFPYVHLTGWTGVVRLKKQMALAIAAAVAVWLALWLVQAAWAVGRAARRGLRAHGWALVPPLFVAYFVLHVVVFFGFRRFLYPAYPFMALSQAVLLAWLLPAGAMSADMAPSGPVEIYHDASRDETQA